MNCNALLRSDLCVIRRGCLHRALRKMFTLAIVGFALLLLGSFLYLAFRDARPLSEEELAQHEEDDLTQ